MAQPRESIPVEPVAAALASADPRLRYSGAAQLAELTAQADAAGQSDRAALLPALLASIDAAAGEPPTDENLRPYPFREALHTAWRAVATADPTTATTWFAAVVDRLEDGDQPAVRRRLEVLVADPWTARSDRCLTGRWWNRRPTRSNSSTGPCAWR